jgi:hypothetical protein
VQYPQLGGGLLLLVVQGLGFRLLLLVVLVLDPSILSIENTSLENTFYLHLGGGLLFVLVLNNTLLELLPCF